MSLTREEMYASIAKSEAELKASIAEFKTEKVVSLTSKKTASKRPNILTRF